MKRRLISHSNDVISDWAFNHRVLDSHLRKKASSRQRRFIGTKDTPKNNVKIEETTSTTNDKEETITTKQIQTSRPNLKDDNPDEITTNISNTNHKTNTTTTTASSKVQKRRPSSTTKSNMLEKQDEKYTQKENKNTNLKDDDNDNVISTTTKETTPNISQPSKVFAKFLENHPTVLSTRPPSYSKLHRASYPDHTPIVTRTKHSNIPILDATHLLSSASSITTVRPSNVHISNQQQIPPKDTYRRNTILTLLRKQEQIPRLSRTYLLQGHGIPYQLLNDHIQCAATLLRTHEDAMNCTFHGNSNGSLGTLSVDGLRVRSRDGINRASHIPDDLYDSMELYWTNMLRMATQLADVFPPHHRFDGRMSQSQTISQDKKKTFIYNSHYQQQASLHISHWNVEFFRGYAFPPSRLPMLNVTHDQQQRGVDVGNNHINNYNGSFLTNPTLFVNWIGRHGISAPGHIVLQLQGTASLSSSSSSSTKLKTTSTSMTSSTQLPLRRPRCIPITLLLDAHVRYDEGKRN